MGSNDKVSGVWDVVGASSGVVTLFLAGLQLTTWMYKKNQEDISTSNAIYKMMDTMDLIHDLYSSAVERENLINIASEKTFGKNLDPIAILSDLGDLMQTGDFKSNEDAINFDIALREFLHNNGKSVDEVNEMMPMIIEKMQSGKDISGILDFYNVNMDDIEQGVDGKAGISGLDLETYILSNMTGIWDTFSKLTFSSQDQKNFFESQKELSQRKVNSDYNGPLGQIATNVWYSLTNSELIDSIYKYEKINGENTMKFGKNDPFRLGNLHFEPYFNSMLEDGNKVFRNKINNKKWGNVQDPSGIVEQVEPSQNIPTQAEVNAYNTRHGESQQVRITTNDYNEQTELTTGKVVASTGVAGVVALSEDDYGLLSGINSNVLAIYGAMGLNNSQVGDEASGGYNSWTATTEMISNINNITNELSFNKLFQQNSPNHFIDISRDFDSVFSELYTMKGQLVSLVNEQKNVKDKLVELSERENNCLGWVTTLSSKSNAYPNGVRVK